MTVCDVLAPESNYSLLGSARLSFKMTLLPANVLDIRYMRTSAQLRPCPHRSSEPA